MINSRVPAHITGGELLNPGSLEEDPGMQAVSSVERRLPC